jgi:hypothetical protein
MGSQFEELTVEQILTRAVGVECRRCHVFLICDWIDQDLDSMMEEHVEKCAP